MPVLGFIGDLSKLEFLYATFLEPARSPEELLSEIQEALEAGTVSVEQVEELISNFK